MPLFDMTDGSLRRVEATTFAAAGVLERTHLQAAIKDNISLLGEDLLVISEEFGDFRDANRRIDLLCIDRSTRPVVVELKRTNDGGHMELQALRYAAMISAMTFDQLVEIFDRYLRRQNQDSSGARAQLADWLDDGEESVVSREVRIILAAGDFGREITTTALWLNDVFNMDIRCVRITPYQVEDRLLLNVEQVIPLPEAEEFTVQLRRREAATRAVRRSSQDWTQYVITSPDGSSGPLRKRHAVLKMAHATYAAGAKPEAILEAIGSRRFHAIDGRLEGEELRDAFFDAYPREEARRWFLDDPIHDDDHTWVVSNQWGLDTVPVLAALVDLVPGGGDYVRPRMTVSKRNPVQMGWSAWRATAAAAAAAASGSPR